MYRNVPGVNAVDATACWDEQYPYSNKTRTERQKHNTQKTKHKYPPLTVCDAECWGKCLTKMDRYK